VSQQTSGLRFDIYERVHLPEDGAGMKELTSIELNPEIFVDRQGEQAVLKGHLILSGSYSSIDETRGEEQLSHQIPVEITLPLNRIQDVDNITVEIENFDVDVLSARSLNVTGVLSLNGIEMVNAAAAEWREEEVVFTHKAGDFAQGEAQANAAPIFEATPDVDEGEDRESATAQQPQQEAAREDEAEPVQAALSEEAVEEEAADAVMASAVEEKKEIKIAFASKSSEESETAFGGLNQLLANTPAPSARSEAAAVAAPPQAAPPAPEAQPAPEAPQPAQSAHAQQASIPSAAAQVPAANPAPAVNAASAETEGKDRLQWKKLFLSASSDEPQFRKVRMCIARKEDTIETIADRYKKNPRELMLYNRLNDQYLHEGQVVYIP
jgi:stage VI sporulation protein D